jgi:anti-sigma factor RsiW
VIDMTAMTCQELVELVSAFVDGELDPVTERRLVDHMAGCDGCGTYIDQFRRTIGTLGELPADKLPADMRDKLLQQFRDEPRPEDSRKLGE